MVSVADGETPCALDVSVAPSPARDRVRISFALPATGRVRIVLYDLAGREVATLVDRIVSAGRHGVTRDVSGLASGVYFVRAVDTEGRVETSKIALLR